MQSFNPILERIKSIKTQKGFTNETLAQKSGIPLGTLSKILSAVIKDPKIGTIIAITDALGVDINSLVYENAVDSTIDLSELEKECIKKYRTLDQRGKNNVQNTLNHEYDLQKVHYDIKEERLLMMSDKDIDEQVEDYRQELVAERGSNQSHKIQTKKA